MIKPTLSGVLPIVIALMLVGCASNNAEHLGYIAPEYQTVNIAKQSVAVQSIDKTQMTVQVIDSFRKNFGVSHYEDVDAIMAKMFTQVLHQQGSGLSALFKQVPMVLVNDSHYDDRPVKKLVTLPNGKSSKVSFHIPSEVQLTSFADKADIVLIINSVVFSDSRVWDSKFSAAKPGSKGGMVNSSQATLALRLDYMFHHIKDNKAVSYGRVYLQQPLDGASQKSDWTTLMERSVRQLLAQSPFKPLGE